MALVAPAVSGIGDGVLLFLVASGLTLIFGVLRLLNFAHGGLFMLGAYMAYTLYTLVAERQPSLGLFLGAVLGAAVAAGGVGLLLERTVFRRLYGLPETRALLGTFALLLVFEGVGQLVWGLLPLSLGQPPQLAEPLRLGGLVLPRYSLLLAVVGAVVLVVLQGLVNGTRFGRDLRAVAEDPQMAALLGVDTRLVFAATVFLGTLLAGLGGALAAPTLALIPDMAGSFIIQAFAVVVIGGMGSVYGSLLAALLVGELNSFLVAFAPGLAGYGLYAVMVLMLLVRPTGLLGRATLEEGWR